MQFGRLKKQAEDAIAAKKAETPRKMANGGSISTETQSIGHLSKDKMKQLLTTEYSAEKLEK